MYLHIVHINLHQSWGPSQLEGLAPLRVESPNNTTPYSFKWFPLRARAKRSTGHAMCFMTQYVFMTETKHLRISQKHSMRAIFMQIWQLEVIFWFMTEKYVHYLKVMKTYFHAVVISTSSDRNRPILRRAGASDERLWVLVCALGSTEGLQVHAEPSKFRVIKHMAWPVLHPGV